MMAAAGGFMPGRTDLPIVPTHAPDVGDAERSRLSDLARRLRRDEPALGSDHVFGPLVSCGLGNAPGLLIGDQREIGLHGNMQVQHFEHRIACLAGAGDLLLVEEEAPAFLDYLSELLGATGIETIALGLPDPGGPTAVPLRAMRRPGLMERIVSRARRAGRLQILAHISTGSTWRMAGEIASAAEVPIRIAGPPLRLARRVNDKVWFTRRLREVLGREALPPTFSAYGPGAMAAKIRHLAEWSETVVVKIPDSAGGEGNIAIDAAQLRTQTLSAIRDLVLDLLTARGWWRDFPLLVGTWESDVLASPSVQTWIPLPYQGDPVIEGVFEQTLDGARGAFVGAARSRMPDTMKDRLVGEAFRLALLLQGLGYFGRCSFDALISGSRLDGAGVHWIECNGRWGGVSLPMTLGNRLRPGPGQAPMLILQDVAQELSVQGMAACRERLEPVLMRRGGSQGVVPLSSAVFDRGRGIHLAAYAAEQETCQELARKAVDLLIR